MKLLIIEAANATGPREWPQVLLWLSGVDVVPGDAGIARLLPGRQLPSIADRAFVERRAGELDAIIADDAVGFAVNPVCRGQLLCHARAREAGIGNQPELLACATWINSDLSARR